MGLMGSAIGAGVAAGVGAAKASGSARSRMLRGSIAAAMILGGITIRGVNRRSELFS
jgi:hypothetical protein